ncbi:MAG: energy-coupling factor transporter transmembrane protein EcfT [Chloroflexi bacterium]|jgi:energy-coupling factor transport system permease protein|nr:energy-coupling factor transporter transmembrane protein EcfT [Chloroflexota bacterium]
MVDARAWLLWAVGVLVFASSCRNPVYALLALAIVALCDAAWARSGERRGLPSPLRFAALAIPLAAVFSMLVSHLGDTVLLRLPDGWPLIGGALTLESVVFGATNGLVLSLIYGAFSLVNRVTPVHDLLRLIPGALHEAGVVLSIALAFIPQTQRSLARIREAQAVRGHRLRGLRDWLPIVVPLLISGLERSMGLAEAMVARGYGTIEGRARAASLQALLACGLLGTVGGWLAWSFFPAAALWGAGGLAIGVAMLFAALRLAGRGTRRTHYRSASWGAEENLVTAGVAVALLGTLAPLPFLHREVLAYAPYPRLSVPPVDPLLALLLLGLLVPAALAVGWGER